MHCHIFCSQICRRFKKKKWEGGGVWPKYSYSEPRSPPPTVSSGCHLILAWLSWSIVFDTSQHFVHFKMWHLEDNNSSFCHWSPAAPAVTFTHHVDSSQHTQVMSYLHHGYPNSQTLPFLYTYITLDYIKHYHIVPILYSFLLY